MAGFLLDVFFLQCKPVILECSTDEKKLDHLSKFLSLVLRHKPEQIGLQLDDQGWAEIAVLIDLALNEPLLHEIVTNNDKQRFALSADGLRIRANQGH